ncbi:MAG TPA: hypothetical protein VGN84_01035 [Solirubrobacterales bacterium]|nr:hypothetical protein [Solirubrobacterales bacterium]
MEKRVGQLEHKNWERSLFAFRLIMYGYAAAFIALAITAIVLAASHSGH